MLLSCIFEGYLQPSLTLRSTVMVSKIGCRGQSLFTHPLSRYRCWSTETCCWQINLKESGCLLLMKFTECWPGKNTVCECLVKNIFLLFVIYMNTMMMYLDLVLTLTPRERWIIVMYHSYSAKSVENSCQWVAEWIYMPPSTTQSLSVGIDCQNIRQVMQWQLPRTGQLYYQKLGRAGRDGAQAEATLFYSTLMLKNKFCIHQWSTLCKSCLCGFLWWCIATNAGVWEKVTSLLLS